MGQRHAKAQFVADRTQNKRKTNAATTTQKRAIVAGGPGGWIERDLEDPQVLNDAKQLAVLTTRHIEKDVTMKGVDYSTIDVSYLMSQVVNGTNYRLEYSVKDKDGDNIMWVTAQLWRPVGQPANRAQVVKSDYNVENINIQSNAKPGPIDRGRVAR